MRKRRVPIGVVVPALLIGLVGLLAALQYRWLGQVSEAEREQLRRSLGQRAREFGDDFDLEITRAYGALQLGPEALEKRDWSALAAACDRWRATARFPQLLHAIYLAEPAAGGLTIRRFDEAARGFEGTPLGAWPPALEPVRARLTGTVRTVGDPSGGTATFVAIAMTPVFTGVPAIVVPVPPKEDGPARPADHARMAPGAALTWLQRHGAFVIGELDGAYLRETVLPALAERHFPERSGDGYRLAVLDGGGRVLFARGLPAGMRIDADHADAVASFFTIRLDLPKDLPADGVVRYRTRTDATPGTEAGPGDAQGGRLSVFIEQRTAEVRGGTGAQPARQLTLLRPSWRIVLQHPDGSLDAAVGRARVRNLWLSFGILGVLGVGVVLIVVNARRAEQLAARQMDFVATVSHELRTPLAVIRSAAQNLAAGVVTDPVQARRYGELIEADGRRLTDMVEEVLTYAGLSGSRQLRAARPIEVAAVVGEVLADNATLLAAAGVSAEVDTGEGGRPLPAVIADEAAIRRAVNNLVTNAVRHGAEGRWVGVSVGTARARGGHEVRISVTDRGRGIDAADLPHVFEPFYRGQRAIDGQVPGNGLGLSLVKRIAEAHGGRVTVRSEPGRGATFTIHLPAALSSPADERLADPAAEAGSSS